ncbi:MAG: MopE-related protein [Myxococcota bacterium]|nr:MopE-related protein [Myxococcota bacterium]
MGRIIFLVLSLFMLSVAQAEIRQTSDGGAGQGPVIPQGENLLTILNRLGEQIDVQADASLVPEVFTPAQILKLSLLARGGGYKNIFGWYNLGDDVADPANRHIVFQCNDSADAANDLKTVKSVNFCDERASGRWKGGPIGFFIVTPELKPEAGGGKSFGLCAPNSPDNYAYYTEPRLSDDDEVNPYIHHLVYPSGVFDNAFYFGFEDLFRGGDDDFEDVLVLVEGLLVGNSPDACNGTDDDCDGRIDEDASVRCQTECGEGVQACSNGMLDACSAPTPSEELCDALDNDCDGLVDEDATRACNTLCGQGTETCQNGGYFGCTAPQPREEICDNVDNDCDTQIDEGVAQACQNRCGVEGLSRCVEGQFQTCDAPTPVAETCNGVDDDCDGETDEGVIRACDGLCGPGIARCEMGVFVECTAPPPAEEICDGLDNDCDGRVDEDESAAADPASADTVTPLSRICRQCGEEGIERCLGGSFVGCTARSPRQNELCNLIDDDCDGMVDEAADRPCNDACGDGVQRCINGRYTACAAPNPQPETCDNIDQDCDGATDENLGRACRTACGPGVERCVEGSFAACDAPTPSQETCNNIDDDCDGSIDEGIEMPCETACGSGTAICVNGIMTSCSARMPAEEICDGIDNDCDDTVDEMLMQACTTPCGGGMQTCQGGRWGECPAETPMVEVCNGKDDNCNGEVDEGAMCTGEAICRAGQCVEPCVMNECTSDAECIDEYCVPIPCLGCRAYEICRADTCVDPCAEVDCDDGAYCLSGECTAGDCYESGCEAGKVCTNGTCTPDDCAVQNCGAGQGCRMGMCFAICRDIECADDERCINGACMADSCAGLTCGDGLMCVDASCEADPCADVQCGPRLTCIAGACEDDPCLATTCPAGSACVVTVAGVSDCESAEQRTETTETFDDDASPADAGLNAVGGQTTMAAIGNDARRESSGCQTASSGTPHTVILLACVLVVPFVRRRWRLAFAALFGLGCMSASDHSSHPAETAQPTETVDGGRSDMGNCIPRREICNEVDDDCNGIVDDVDDLSRNVEHCGQCGRRCVIENADPTCLGGQCRVKSCAAGFVNADGLSANGCEAECIMADDPTEICNGKDDDCDGVADEGFNLGGDIDNCGICGRSCLTDGVQRAECISGRCVISACIDGRTNLDGKVENGCEYGCTMGADEVCNGQDDDCDGQVDEGLTTEITCKTDGLCAGAVAECLGDEGFGCAYPEGAGGETEAACDGLDNDCDGKVDEDFAALGTPCDGPDEDRCINGVVACSVDGTGTSCREVPGGSERCDSVDNDCDERIDEGFDLMVDAKNCGACGMDCHALNTAEVACTDGRCTLTRCQDGFVDLDDDPMSGCEYPCQPSGNASDDCDGQDDDCDGRIDEDAGPAPDQTCLSEGVCAGSIPLCLGPMGFDCSYPTTYSPNDEGVCDGLDNDCDGQIDEAFPALGTPCDGADLDRCKTGITVCGPDGVSTVCTDDEAAVTERCDGADNDCDDEVDEGFNLMLDPLHCGACNRDCARAAAQTSCVDGVCKIDACEPGFVDVNDLAIDGCETECPNGVDDETCNGVDDDCDGKTDEGVVAPVACAGPGVCSDLVARCLGADGFDCPYPTAYEETEVSCDDLDNDCDGLIDEAGDNAALANKGATCTVGIGACQQRGTLVCNDEKTTTVCTATALEPAAKESCNGLDDDCDGTIDEEIPRADEMVQIGTSTVFIDRYEASRPDATAELAGFQTARACSRAGVQPWVNVTFAEAEAACNARGKRLCTDTEWASACGTGFPYGDQYDATACHTAQPSRQVTGLSPNCENAGTFDMSGNVAEWATCARQVDCQVVRPLLGGSFADRIQAQFRCDFRGNGAPQLSTETVGFRCCADAP